MNKNKKIYAMLMASLMVATVFGAISVSAASDNEKSVVVNRYVKSCISEDFSPYVPVNSYIDSDGSQVIPVDGDTKMFIEMNENNVITPDSTGSNSVLSSSGVSRNGDGFNLVLKEGYACYVNPSGGADVVWGFVVINMGDDYTFTDDTITVRYTLYFNYGDERDFSSPVYQLTTSTGNGEPFVWEHGMGDCECFFFMMDPGLGKPKNITGVYEILSPENPDINPDDNMKTIDVPYCILVDYKVVNLTGKPVKDAKVVGPWKWFDINGPGIFVQGCSIRPYTLSNENGEGCTPVLTKEPYSEAHTYNINASKTGKYQRKTTEPVKEGDKIHLDFVLDVPGVKSKTDSTTPSNHVVNPTGQVTPTDPTNPLLLQILQRLMNLR